jgi:radical SAM protein with 4Fe4S-binding SPASM domain
MFEKVRMVEIEISNYCNRTCSWCPNSFIDRRSDKIDMDENTYLKILKELQALNYSGTISYSRYNEPTANGELLIKRLSQAREIVPAARLVTNTNGDYITKKLLEKIEIDELSIMDYDNKGMEAILAKMNKIGISVEKTVDNNIYGLFTKKNGKQMKIVYSVNWPKEAKIGNRATSLKEYINAGERTKPCHEPTYFIGIDYNGSITPCCEFRSDYEPHVEMMLGNVNNNTLREIYESEKATKFRESVANAKFGKLCKYCIKGEGRYTRQTPGIEFK